MYAPEFAPLLGLLVAGTSCFFSALFQVSRRTRKCPKPIDSWPNYRRPPRCRASSPTLSTVNVVSGRHARSTRSSRRCRLLMFFVFVFCRFQSPCAAVQPHVKRHEHDWSKLPHSYVFVSTPNHNNCHGTRRTLKSLFVCSLRPVITSKNEEVLDSTPASPGNESDKTSVKGAEQGSGKGDLFNWMKGSSSSIFSMVAEKAKHSVDAVLTTLDPQMKDSLNRK